MNRLISIIDMHMTRDVYKRQENILSMTKIESGQQFVNKSPEVVDDVINEASLHVIGLRAVSYTHLARTAQKYGLDCYVASKATIDDLIALIERIKTER